MRPAVTQRAEEPIPKGRGHAKIPPAIDVMMNEVVPLESGGERAPGTPLMAGIMEHVIGKIGKAEPAHDQKREPVAEQQQHAAQNDGKDRYRSRKRHDVTARIGGIGVMTPVNQKSERASGGDPAVEMKKEAMKEVFDERPGDRAAGDGDGRLRWRELTFARPDDDAKARDRHPEENDGGKAGAREAFEKVAAKKAQRPALPGAAIAGFPHVANGVPGSGHGGSPSIR